MSSMFNEYIRQPKHSFESCWMLAARGIPSCIPPEASIKEVGAEAWMNFKTKMSTESCHVS